MGRRDRRDLSCLAPEWEANDEFRSQVRSCGQVLDCGGSPVFHATVATCAAHKGVFAPVLKWMASQGDSFPMPDIEPLKDALKQLYNLLNMVIGQDQIYREAWGIPHGCGLLKRKYRRKEVSKAWIYAMHFNLCMSGPFEGYIYIYIIEYKLLVS